MLKKATKKITRIFYRSPDFYIGGAEQPYIRRWYVIPRNRWFNIYLHNMLRDDDDRALHDHPWLNMSIILRGGYIEHVPERPNWYPNYSKAVIQKYRSPGDIIFRKPTSAHRLELFNDQPWPHWRRGMPIKKKPSWSLFITGPRVREWGFLCPQGWVHYKRFVDPTDTGKTGKGCDQ